MTRRQYLTIMAALGVVLIVAMLAIYTSLLSAQASCERGNPTRARLGVPKVQCQLLAPITH